MKKFIFWYRRFSDLDHLIPIANLLVEKGIDPKRVIMTDLDFDNSLRSFSEDLLIKYIVNKGIIIKKSFFAKGFIDLREFLIKNNKYKILKIFFYFALKLLEIIKYIYFLNKIIFYCNKNKNNTKFICDHGSSKIYLTLSKNCLDKSIPLVSLPHGLMLHDGLKNEQQNRIVFKKTGYYYPHFSEIVLTDKQSRKFYSNENNIKILGSARYSKKWISVLNGIYSKLRNFNENKRLKILLLLDKEGGYENNKFINYYDKIALIKTLQVLQNNSNVQLIIKMHPSSKKETMPELFNYCVLDQKSSTNTFQLIKSFDIILSLSSSALLDALLLNKKLGILSYVTNFRSIVSEKIEEINIKSLDQLKDFVSEVDIKNKEQLNRKVLDFYSTYISNGNRNIELDYFEYINK